MKKATPLITVDAIEPCLPFWTEGMGFELTATVPQEGTFDFAMLQNGSVELMYQTRSSIEADLGAPEGLAKTMADGTAALFVEVESLEDVLNGLGDAEVLVPRRQTFYGMDEVFVRAPCGTVIGFAARLPEATE